MAILNQTLFKITFNWDRTKFEASRHQCRVARKRVEMSINVQFEKQIRGVFSRNINIEENIHASDEHLLRYHDKLRILDNMIELASQSLIVYFQKRMESVRAIVNEHCQAIQQIVQEEAEHWKEIHAVLDQNLLNPGDIRSRTDYPKVVQKSPASNIQVIEEDDEEETAQSQLSKLMNESKPSPSLPPSKEHIDLSTTHEHSILRKHEQASFQILPLSANRPPLKIVDTTFVIKPEEANLYGELLYTLRDEANGTYRAMNPPYLHDPLMCQGEMSLLDPQPQIPARLCFSPTILHDPAGSPQKYSDEDCSSSTAPEQASVPVIKIDRCRFGQTFLLDTIKKESVATTDINYVRPAIPDQDDDVVIIRLVGPPAPPAVTTRDVALNTSHQPIPVKSRKRVKTKSKTKSVVISTRKTRSATKDPVEGAAATTTTTAPVDKAGETKRKTRKRKPSKSNDRAAKSSDEEPERTVDVAVETKRKPKKPKKSGSDKRQIETENEETERSSSTRQRRTDSKRKTRSKMHDEDRRETTNRTKTRRRARVEEQEEEQTEYEQMRRNQSIKRKKSKAKKKTENESTKTRTKKSRKTDETEDQSKQPDSRISAKREYRSTRGR